MELHKAIKKVVEHEGIGIIANLQLINFLLDYQAFKEKPATKLILRDIINSGYAEEILSLNSSDTQCETKFKKFQHDFIDSCGYKEELATYVFEALAYGIGLKEGDTEPEIRPAFNVDSFFDLPEDNEIKQQTSDSSQQKPSSQTDPSDFYTIALSFYTERKYTQAKSFMEKALSLSSNSSIPSLHLKLMAEIHMKLELFQDALKYYNECFKRKASEDSYNSLNSLQEALKNHKVKGFENCIFYYFFCLYRSNGITDAQWLQFVKGEARYGLMEAIMYCADNGINPIDDHFDIYFVDKALLKTGDYLYDDGSFSHELSKTKNAIAKIALVETSVYEQSKGWTHGYILPLNPICAGFRLVNRIGNLSFKELLLEWSNQKVDLPFPHSHYNEDDIRHWEEIEKVESEQFVSITDYQLYPAFQAVEMLNRISPVPLKNASEWFLPSVHTIKRFDYNYYLLPDNFNFKNYWTSSQCDANQAISFRKSVLSCVDKGEKLLIWPVASF